MNYGDARQERLLITQIAISVVVFLGALGVVFFSDDSGAVKWAIGIAGLVVGYWLRESLIIFIVIVTVIVVVLILII